jgi:hypothetical protein
LIRYDTNKYLAASRQNQHNAFATSMNPDQPAHPCSLIRIHAVRLQTLLSVEKVKANSVDPDQNAQMCRLVSIHAICWFCHGAAHIIDPESESLV